MEPNVTIGVIILAMLASKPVWDFLTGLFKLVFRSKSLAKEQAMKEKEALLEDGKAFRQYLIDQNELSTSQILDMQSQNAILIDQVQLLNKKVYDLGVELDSREELIQNMTLEIMKLESKVEILSQQLKERKAKREG